MDKHYTQLRGARCTIQANKYNTVTVEDLV